MAAKRHTKSEGGGGSKGAYRRARAEGTEMNGEVNCSSSLHSEEADAGARGGIALTETGGTGRIEGCMAALEKTPSTLPRWRGERWWLLAVGVMVGWFYVWTARNEAVDWKFGQRQTDYYNLLVDGWLDGHLYMKVEVPEVLLKLADPYNPAMRPPGVALHDASMYRGHYYIYFGAAPVVTLMLPFRVLSGGVALPLPVAVMVFTFAGFVVSAGIFLGIRRRYFPEAGTGIVLVSVLALGTASMGPLLVLRGSIWELPLSSGYFFVMMALACVWRSVHAERRAAWWLAGAGLSLGLAVASRPTYLFTSGLLAVPVLWRWWQARAEGRSGLAKAGRLALAGAVPLGAVGLAMAAYNYARFGSPTEFGVAYQFSGIFEAETQHFRWSYLPLNLWMYWMEAAEWTRYFPFLHRGPTPPIPAGHLGFDDVYGVLVNVPLVWLALGLAWAGWRRGAGERGPLLAVLGAAGMIAAGTAVPLALFYAAMARYGADFMPALVLLATTGALALQRKVSVRGVDGSRTRWRMRVVNAGCGVLAVWSIFFAVVLSFDAYGNLRRLSPRTYGRIAMWCNFPSWWIEKLSGTEHGPLELDWAFATKTAGTRESLVRTGTVGARDELFLVHEGNGRGRIGYAHEGGAGRMSESVALEGATGRTLRVEMGSLYPPEEHPFFRGMSAAERIRLARRLVVKLGDKTLVEEYQRFHASSPRDVVARGARRVGGSDEIRAAVRAEAKGDEAVEFGVVTMKVIFPEGRKRGREPLVVTGETGRADFLFVEYLDGGRVQFGLDHWGKATVMSAPWAVERGKACAVTIAMGSFPGALRPEALEVTLDERVVWAREAKFFGVGAEDVFVGKNPIGGTGCAEMFTGTILDVVRGEKPDSVR